MRERESVEGRKQARLLSLKSGSDSDRRFTFSRFESEAEREAMQVEQDMES